MGSRGRKLVELAISNSGVIHKDDDSLSEDTVISDTTDGTDSESDFRALYSGLCTYDKVEANSMEEAEKSIPSVQHSEISSTSNASPVMPVISPIIRTQEPVEVNEEIFSCPDTENGEISPTTTETAAKTNKNYLRMPDCCYYCEVEVHNFARHIQRNHCQEFEVQKIISFPPKSIQRKHLIASLRKKGNYLKNSGSLYKPVHRSQLDNSENNYLACPFCLGSYSRKLLWKHKKICPDNKNPGTRTTLGEGQSLLIPKFQGNSELCLKIFPRMLADKVSLAVKKDPLICAFGSRFLSTHREQHHVNVCSRKMRELGKVLIESKKLNPEIRNLFDLLQPQHFDTVVQSVKIIAKYDPQKDVYISPTFAMNISSSLKDCCDIAILHIVKRKYNYQNLSAAEAEANILLFTKLIESTWKYEISSQAANDLNTKTWNKVTLIPLATDLKLFRTYLVDKGNEAEKNLKKDMANVKHFNLLMETIFSRLLLLNRKRVGELQRMKLNTYIVSEKQNTSNYEEFSEAITPTEKILLKSFRRVVTRGKRGRGVPVLFSKDIQEHLKLLLKARDNFVQQTNLFLFPNIKSDKPIVGYKVLQKHAHLCGAKNPKALTSTRLRKHLATLTQVFNMSNNDIEQLATFMGHTISVHSKVYRLPDDVYQTAKIAKLLMLMEKGDAAKFKGKSLEEIDVNMDEEINDESENECENIPPDSDRSLDIDILESDDKIEQLENFRPTNTKRSKKRELIPWTTQQRRIVLDFFKSHIQSKKPPKKDECLTLLKNYPDILKNKSWPKIKVFVQNHYTKKCSSVN